MSRIILKRAAGLGALLVLFSVVAVAQTGQIEGTVRMKTDDGTKGAPVVGATIDIYRLDIKGHFETKTDKSGRYIRIGIPIQGTYLFVVSGPNLQPTWSNNVRLAQVPVLDFTVAPGNGSRPTFEEVQAAIKGTGATTAGPTASKEDRAKADAAQKEAESRRAEAAAMQASFDQAREHFGKGVELEKASNYDAALAELQQATTVDISKHSAFAEVVHKANAHIAQVHAAMGTDIFNKNRKAVPEAKPHFEEAVKAIKKAIEVASLDTANANINNDLITYYGILANNGKILVQHFQQAELADDLVQAFDKAAALDPTNKAKWDVRKAEIYRFAFKSDEAIAMYKQILAADPANAEAMYGLGLTLIMTGDPTKLQEAANVLADFVAKAPASDPRVAEVNQSLADLKREYKVEAEKPSKRGRKP